jgi:hypothetical protein
MPLAWRRPPGIRGRIDLQLHKLTVVRCLFGARTRRKQTKQAETRACRGGREPRIHAMRAKQTTTDRTGSKGSLRIPKLRVAGSSPVVRFGKRPATAPVLFSSTVSGFPASPFGAARMPLRASGWLGSQVSLPRFLKEANSEEAEPEEPDDGVRAGGCTLADRGEDDARSNAEGNRDES